MEIQIILMVLVGCVVGGVPKTEDGILQNIQESSVEALLTCNSSILSDYNWNHSNYLSFNPRAVQESDSACLATAIFTQMGFITSFNISELTFSRFILHVQKGYHNIPYHNWSHGFSVLQFCYAVLRQERLIEKQYISAVEGLALLTAALCHDLDHPATDNTYQRQADTPLYHKYKDVGSYLERHHIEETMKLLSNPETNFISHFGNEEVNNFKNLIKQMILATDLNVHHTQQLPKIREMIKSGFRRDNQSDRELLCSQIISCADLSDQTRDWRTVRSMAKSVLSEFYNQGDLMKQHHLNVSAMYDRHQADVPHSQIYFISTFVEPAFEILHNLLPETQQCIQNVKKNKCFWEMSIPYFRTLRKFENPLDIIMDNQLDFTGC